MRNGMQWLIAGAIGLAGLAACGGGGGSDPGDGGGDGAGSMAASVAGAGWEADGAQVQVTAGSTGVPGSIIITGTDIASQTSYVSISLLLGYIGGPGSYTLGVNLASSPGGTASLFSVQGANQEIRQTIFSGAAGTLTVTSLTADRITGTFTFTAAPLPGSALVGDRTVTQGTFDVALPTGFTSVPAANHGSTISATIGGVAWNGATVLGLGSGGVFTLGGQTTTRSVNILTNTVVTVGTYDLGSSMRLTVVEFPGGQAWGGLAGDVGTVTITSLANGRGVGTFGGTLNPVGPPGPAALVVTGGTFDVRIDPPN